MQVRMATAQSPFGDGMNRRPCQSKGCCRRERLYLPDGGYEEIQTECHSVGLPQNVFKKRAARMVSCTVYCCQSVSLVRPQIVL